MDALKRSNRVVIKIGSALIAKPDTGRANFYWMAGLAKDIVSLRAQGKQVCIVCSGAVTLGRDILKLPKGRLLQNQKQAAAACGQMVLMRAWEEVFTEDVITVAQILLTIDDSESRSRYLNARATLNTLLDDGVIPIINENDCVATESIRVGDNDRLAARAAQMIDAEALLLLSDIDGLYTADPTKDPDARFIAEIDEITDDIRAYAAPASTMVGTGGMITKVEAASIATSSGCNTIICRGDVHKPVQALIDGGKHSVFIAKNTPLSARKEWLAGALSPAGTLRIDKGAIAALKDGNSLLPVGIVSVSGTFQRGDALLIEANTADKALIAKGLSLYSSDELHHIIGKQSYLIEELLGYTRGDAVIHRDDMVML